LGASAVGYLANTDVNAVTIVARAQTDSGVSFSREAVVALDATSRAAFKYLAWRQNFGPPEVSTSLANQ
jgi:hypothetical protein